MPELYQSYPELDSSHKEEPMIKPRKLRCLLVGSGARESALAWKLSRSKYLEKLYVYPGLPVEPYNSVISLSLTQVRRDLGKQDDHIFSDDPAPGAGLGTNWQNRDLRTLLARWAKAQKMDLVFCGPETPLCAGLADAMVACGVRVWGPVAAVARLEGSKVFAKEIMDEAGVPQARYDLAQNPGQALMLALKRLRACGQVVIKADGLAGGKGVFVCHSEDDVRSGLRVLFEEMAGASEQVVIEECLAGRECSYFAWVHGDQVKTLGFARDYKRLLSGDRGPNTGGMGCYTPVPWLPQGSDEVVREKVITPLLKTLKSHGLSYTGFLYVGLMWGDAEKGAGIGEGQGKRHHGPQVLEFNIRLGDPEAQVLAIADSRDWLEVCDGMLGASLDHLLDESPHEEVIDKAHRKNNDFKEPYPVTFIPSVCAVLASPCYPWKRGPLKPHTLPVDIWEEGGQVRAFGGSISRVEGKIVSGRGRVLSLVASAETHSEARSVLYERLADIRANIWPDCQYRDDIAQL